MYFDFATLPGTAYDKLLHATVVPRPIAWVTTLGKHGQLNAAPFSFFNVVSTKPPMVCLGVGRRDNGEKKDTARNLLESRQMVINLVPYTLREPMNLTSADYPPDVDELALAGLRTVPSEKIAPPRVANSPVALECELFSHVEPQENHFVFIANVLGMHVHDPMMKDAARHHVSSESLDLIARMHGGGWYARTTDLFQMPRPPAPPDQA